MIKLPDEEKWLGAHRTSAPECSEPCVANFSHAIGGEDRQFRHLVQARYQWRATHPENP